jgi:AcrR family transcriptional regulator
MPKRNAAYMEDQRDAILRAALDCMLELGVAATSMRAIAQRAGVTTGAVYVHFDSREELIVAAALSQSMFSLVPVDNWAAFTGIIEAAIHDLEIDPRYRSMQRAMYEFVGDVDLAKQSIPLWDGYLDDMVDFFRGSLVAMRVRGEVSLPLGLETTVQTLLQQLSGATYMLFANPRATAAEISETVRAGVAHIAGYKERQSET